MYAEIIVDRPIIQRRQKAAQADENPLAMTFHYHIPPALAAELVVGHLVSVPFRAEQLSGVVTALTETSPVAKTRPVTAILDPIPVLTAAQLKLARWLSHEYLAPLATCVKFFLPPGSARKPEFVLEKPLPAPSPARPIHYWSGCANKKAHRWPIQTHPRPKACWNKSWFKKEAD
jgi:primosomal protein N'